MLNDCPNVKEEALLAIKWKEPVILRQHLQDNAHAVLKSKAAQSNATRAAGRLSDADADKEEEGDKKEDVDLLQVAPQHRPSRPQRGGALPIPDPRLLSSCRAGGAHASGRR